MPGDQGQPGMKTRCCRFCGTGLRHTFVDLGMSPLANAYLTPAQLGKMEPYYPLHVQVCERCFLVQLAEFADPESIFSDYAYFASYSDTWLRHAQLYVDMAIERFGLGRHSQVIEIACNDGYLLQYFVAQEIPVLGIEPAANVAETAIQKGIPTRVAFFGEDPARQLIAEGLAADLVVANNVLAHVPQLNDFVRGLKLLLKPHGVVTLEFPHLLRLMTENQFDTIYQEHFSYFSFTTAEQIFARHGLACFDVEEIPTHGGSIRVYARHGEDASKAVSLRVTELKAKEETAGLSCLDTYLAYTECVRETKRKLLTFLIAAKRAGKSVVGYGAPAKGNTLLNYCGIGTDFIDYTVDRSPYKQGRFLPGTHIPIYHPDIIKDSRPDYLLILPWNLADEIIEQMGYARDWGAQFVIPIPEARVMP
jgi:2-polyprenyl-3-methyl-5-hydroxy-6-metoxy-1,4-benzoquinol methylase